MLKKSPTSPKEDIAESLIKNNLLLQEKLVDLIKSNQQLTKEISSMVSFFKEAGELMVAESEDEKLRPLFKNLNELLDQNKTIVRGLLLIQKYIKTASAPSSLEERSSPLDTEF